MKTTLPHTLKAITCVRFRIKTVLTVKYCLLLSLFLLQASTSLAQTRGQLTKPLIWLRGDKGTVTPALWSDTKEDSWKATALKGEEPAVDGVLNYNKALVFDGINDYMKISYSLERLPSFTMIVVYQPADTAERGIFGTEKALARKAMLSTKRALGPDNTIDTFSESEDIPVLNTVTQSWSETLAIGDSAYIALGSAGRERGKASFKGLIAEFMVFGKSLTFLERLQTETYLALKYGIPMHNSNYVSAEEEILWHAENNSKYSNRIAGIGRSDAFSLYQKQSVSVVDTSRLIVVSAGALAATNAANTSLIENNNFLIWGDNNSGLTAETDQQQHTVISVLERKWLMDVTGTTANQIPTELQVDLKLLPKSSLGYWLVINRSEQEDFHADKLEYILADSVSADSIAFFRNITWDPDNSGADLFSFSSAKNMFATLGNIGHPLCPTPADGSASITVVGGKAPYQYELRNAITGFYQKWEGTQETSQSNLTAGNYTLLVTDAAGNTSERIFTLQTPETLLVELGEDQQLEKGKEITLDATVSASDFSAITYLWEGSNGFTSAEPKVRITEPGDYVVTVTNKNGCSFTDKIQITRPADTNLLVYPTIVKNGQNYQIAVSLDEPTNIIVRVFDLKGILLQEMKGNNQSNYQFTGNGLGPGMYMVVLETPDTLSSKKIIVN